MSATVECPNCLSHFPEGTAAEHIGSCNQLDSANANRLSNFLQRARSDAPSSIGATAGVQPQPHTLANGAKLPLGNALLPPEMLAFVFSYLDLRSVAQCSQVCRQWYAVSKDGRLCRRLDISCSLRHQLDRNAMLQVLNRAGPTLEILNAARQSVDLDENDWPEILQNSPNLTSANLRDCRITPAAVDTMPRNLKVLSLAECSHWRAPNHEKCFDRLAAACPRLESLSLDQLMIDDEELQQLQALRGLTRISLVDCDSITPDALASFLEAMPQLRSINVTACRAVGNAMARKISPEMKVLVMSHVKCVSAANALGLPPTLEPANTWTQMQRLDLAFCEVGDSDLSILSIGCRQLRYIDLTGNEGVRTFNFHRFAHLATLILRHCPKVTDTALALLQERCGELQRIDLTNCRLLTSQFVAGMGQPADPTRLVVARLGSTKIDDEALGLLASRNPNLHILGLNHCPVTDDGIARLAEHCKRLTVLDLKSCRKLTNQSLTSMRDLGQLNDVNVFGVPFTKDELDRFNERAEKPRTHV